MRAAITVDRVSKSYVGALVLDDVTVDFASESLTVVTGPSGSGKTTLINLISTLDLCDRGTITVAGVDVTSLSRRDRDHFRASNGHVFQRSGMLGGLTLRENIEAPHVLTGRPVDGRWVEHLVTRLGVRDLLDVGASRASGGQAQRAALVRSLAHRPSHLFADEPTASLDTASTHAIHALLSEVAACDGTTVVMVSHDEVSLDYADRVVRLVDGRIRGSGES